MRGMWNSVAVRLTRAAKFSESSWRRHACEERMCEENNKIECPCGRVPPPPALAGGNVGATKKDGTVPPCKVF